ncbi:MAG: acetyl-CoA decarbonylase/synthase complex subunit gamma [Methanoregulaceae archaeon]|jgi:acetyl-CoA decarbonylase/synthase complex subunit gamma|nr:acetyl-CoA decarbonylase/synthase complex subunit gamma [Methanoregulaceae archaeon]
MTKKKLGPMNLYPLLPRTNCGECLPKTCMGFAVQLCERGLTLGNCPPLKAPEFQANHDKLEALLAPPVKEIVIGKGEKEIKVGGQLVMHRHELRYFNKTAIFTTVDDTMIADDITSLVQETSSFSHPYIGHTLKLDGITIRSRTGNAENFRKTVEMVAGLTDLPLILWSSDPGVMSAGLGVAGDRRPLIYAADESNWQEMSELASSTGCPLAVHADGNVGTIRSLVSAISDRGVKNLLIDPGCGFGEALPKSLDNMTMIRTSAISGEDSLLGYPLIGSPVTLWDQGNSLPGEAIRWMESCLASMMTIRYADLVMIRDPSMWSTLPLVVLINNLYNDPRKPVSVEPGLRVFGTPDPVTSPVLITSNFALTYYTVLSDIEKLNCYLLVADTEGLSVDSAVAGRKFNAQKVADIISSSGISKKVTHRTLIIPGLAARLKGDIEDAINWDVMVGPRDSAGIPAYLREKWDGVDHKPGWSYR